MPIERPGLTIAVEKKRSSVDADALAAFARRAQSAVRLKGSVGVLVTGDEQMRRLNRRFRRKDKATDVLSFPGTAPGVAGDIAISAEIAAVNAKVYRHPVQQEIQILLLHGMLHLAGYDHESDAGEMSRKEAALRRRLGLPASLIARTQEKVRLTPARKRKLP